MVWLRLSFFFLFCCLASRINSQSIEELQKRKQLLQKSIEQNTILLEQFAGKKSDELKVMELLDGRIDTRKELIAVYYEEILGYEKHLQKLSISLDSLNMEINAAKKDYAAILSHLAVNRVYRQDLTYLLASDSFQEAYRRYLFMKQYNSYRKQQGELLQVRQKQYEELKIKISQRKEQLFSKYTILEQEKAQLQKEMEERKVNLVRISKREGEIRKDLLAAQKSAKELENRIVELIREAAKSKKTDKSSSKAIRASSGKLNWPVSDGEIVSAFGEHEHAVIKSLKVKNNGIDIKVTGDLTVRSISGGIVSRIVAIPGYNVTVIVKHGNIFTVYANLVSVKVQHDQSIREGDVIGLVFSGEGKNREILHFEIWEGEKKQNPETWLEKR